jgi:hypothetical protein
MPPLGRHGAGRLEFLRDPFDIGRSERRMSVRQFESGAVMNDHSDNKTESPYSTLRCILLLLATGIAVKTGAALHLCHLGSCY